MALILILLIVFIFWCVLFKYKQIESVFVLNKNDDVKKIIFYLSEHFEQDSSKVYIWLTTPNPNFGDNTPYDMIKLGRERRLLEFIENQRILSGYHILH